MEIIQLAYSRHFNIILQVVPHKNLKDLQDKHYYLHFKMEETELEEVELSCLGTHNRGEPHNHGFQIWLFLSSNFSYFYHYITLSAYEMALGNGYKYFLDFPACSFNFTVKVKDSFPKESSTQLIQICV